MGVNGVNPIMGVNPTFESAGKAHRAAARSLRQPRRALEPLGGISAREAERGWCEEHMPSATSGGQPR